MKRRMLYAAMAEFAERGFDAASLGTIAARVQSTSSLLVYHFGSKEGLAEAVAQEIRRTFVPPAVPPREAIDSTLTWRAVVKDYLLSVLDFLADPAEPNCHLAGLIRFEAAQRRLRGGSVHALVLQPILDGLSRLLVLGLADPSEMVARLWTTTVWQTLFAAATEGAPLDGVHRRAVIDFLVEQVLSPLRFH